VRPAQRAAVRAEGLPGAVQEVADVGAGAPGHLRRRQAQQGGHGRIEAGHAQGIVDGVDPLAGLLEEGRQLLPFLGDVRVEALQRAVQGAQVDGGADDPQQADQAGQEEGQGLVAEAVAGDGEQQGQGEERRVGQRVGAGRVGRGPGQAGLRPVEEQVDQGEDDEEGDPGEDDLGRQGRDADGRGGGERPGDGEGRRRSQGQAGGAADHDHHGQAAQGVAGEGSRRRDQGRRRRAEGPPGHGHREGHQGDVAPPGIVQGQPAGGGEDEAEQGREDPGGDPRALAVQRPAGHEPGDEVGPGEGPQHGERGAGEDQPEGEQAPSGRR
jgi:hypothetical protein